MFLNEIKIIDLKRSKFDTSEKDSLTVQLEKLGKDRSSLKPPVTSKDEASTASHKKALESHKKKSKDLELKIEKVKEKLTELEKREKKDKSKGLYKFAKGGRVYTDKMMADTTGGLDFGYKFKWNRNDDRAINDWNIKHGFELVTVKDSYLPEGVPPNGEGKFVFGDAILSKITLRKYAEKQMIAQARSDKAVASKFKDFKATLESKGVEASDEFIGDWKEGLGIKD